ncbi:MAG: hypothetical protein AB1489_15900 [Acidobacteriota bacterium]
MIQNNCLRPAQYLAEYATRYPGIWQQIDELRQRYRKEWPSWCYCSIRQWLVELEKTIPTSNPIQVIEYTLLPILASWRATQSIYMFDKTLMDHLWETPLEDKIPIEVLFHLPEWAVYISTPGRKFHSTDLNGFFALMEWDCVEKRPELMFGLDQPDGLFSISLPLSSPSINENLDVLTKEVDNLATKQGIKLPVTTPIYRQTLPCISLVLYLCTQAAEIRDSKGTDRQPRNPKPQHTKHGLKIIPASHPTIWEVGYRLGATLRTAEQREASESQDGIHASPRSHIRKAHWHHYWTGPRDSVDRKLILKWLHPILVAAHGVDELVPVIRAVD